MPEDLPSRNIGLDLVRVTETAALAAGSFIGSGDYDGATRAATLAMADALNTLNMNGCIVVGEDGRMPNSPLASKCTVGTGNGPDVDIIVDPIDGTNLLIKGLPGAISVLGIAPRGAMWSPVAANYLEKIVVDRRVADALVPDCMTAPAAWTLALIARVLNKSIRDLSVIVLNRPRNQDLIAEIRLTGARILLRDEADAEGALLAVDVDSEIDALMGVGGATQGILAACMARAMKGGVLAKLSPQDAEERAAVMQAGYDLDSVLTCKQIIASEEVFLAVTGITHTPLLPSMKFHRDHAETFSLLIRGETGTRRFIHAEHVHRM